MSRWAPPEASCAAPPSAGSATFGGIGDADSDPDLRPWRADVAPIVAAGLFGAGIGFSAGGLYTVRVADPPGKSAPKKVGPQAIVLGGDTTKSRRMPAVTQDEDSTLEAPLERPSSLPPEEDERESVTTLTPMAHLDSGKPPIIEPRTETDVRAVGDAQAAQPRPIRPVPKRVPLARRPPPRLEDFPTATAISAAPPEAVAAFDNGEPPTAPRRPSGLVDLSQSDGYEVEDRTTLRGERRQATPRERGRGADEPLAGGTAGSARRVARVPPLASGDAAGRKRPLAKLQDPALEKDDESITTRAPGHMTNMLRVMTSDESEALPTEESPQNRTAVMATAPVKPAMIANGPLPVSTSIPTLAAVESAPRMDGMAFPQPEARNLGVPPVEAWQSSFRPAEPMGAHPTASPAEAAYAQGDSYVAPIPRRPRYGLLVSLVALASITIPSALFFALNLPAEAVTPRIASEAQPDIVRRIDPPRGKKSASNDADPERATDDRR